MQNEKLYITNLTYIHLGICFELGNHDRLDISDLLVFRMAVQLINRNRNMVGTVFT